MAKNIDTPTHPPRGLVELEESRASPLIRASRCPEADDGLIFHLPSNLLTDPNEPHPRTPGVQSDHFQNRVNSDHIRTPTTPVKLNPLATAFTPGMPMTSITPIPATPSMTSLPITPSCPARISAKSIINNLLGAKAGEDSKYATVTMAFVSHCCGPAQNEHLETNESGRVVLRNDSQLRLRGVALGLPKEFVEWLCGQGGETLTIHMSTLFERKCALSHQ